MLSQHSLHFLRGVGEENEMPAEATLVTSKFSASASAAELFSGSKMVMDICKSQKAGPRSKLFFLVRG